MIRCGDCGKLQITGSPFSKTDSNKKTQTMKIKFLLFAIALIAYTASAKEGKILQPYVVIVQPIVIQSDEGTNPASMALPEDLVDNAYENAKVDFLFLEPIYYNNTKARDGEINLDMIVNEAQKSGLIKGQDDIVNMFFVNAVDGKKGPLGRGMMGGNLTFIALGDETDKSADELKYLQTFVIAHEVGHNLSLKHAVDDPNVADSIPNIQGDGEFKDRVDPKYSLNDYQIDIIHQSPLVHSRVEFLSKTTGQKAILDESFEPYFSQLQVREITAFTQKNVPNTNIDEARIFAKKEFASAVTDFTESEKQCISFVLNEVNNILQENDISLMAEFPWRLIKIEDWLCGGFAHTRGTYIILSQRHIDHLSTGWSNNMTSEERTTLVKRFGALLVHEQMHSLQRVYKSKFQGLFTDDWNFVQANVQPEFAIQIDQVSNPDAPIAEWLIPDKEKENSFFWVRTLLKETEGIPAMGKDFTNKVFSIQKTENAYQVKKDSDGKLISTTLSDIDYYVKSFPPNRGIDHPNEISAYLFADYFSSLVLKEKPFKDVQQEAVKYSNLFMNWIDSEMKEQ